ncbi:preprotein translocase subunit SecE [Sneathia vaginalis]|uniref:preprotein translocase subunit SecE n=1 Tax=Sneathia vaginalis TaxID=187101 RepID=UPI00288BFC8D|nr:preprotein translocase subunit SecE [Sneathia vaginalis]
MKDEKKKNLLTRIVDEYKKVTWASASEVVQVTIIVLLITAFIAVMIIMFDFAFNLIIKNATTLLRSLIK